MSAMASQITDVSNVYSMVCLGADQRILQSSASLAFVRGIHRWPFNFFYILSKLQYHQAISKFLCNSHTLVIETCLHINPKHSENAFIWCHWSCNAFSPIVNEISCCFLKKCLNLRRIWVYYDVGKLFFIIRNCNSYSVSVWYIINTREYGLPSVFFIFVTSPCGALWRWNGRKILLSPQWEILYW